MTISVEYLKAQRPPSLVPDEGVSQADFGAPHIDMARDRFIGQGRFPDLREQTNAPESPRCKRK